MSWLRIRGQSFEDTDIYRCEIARERSYIIYIMRSWLCLKAGLALPLARPDMELQQCPELALGPSIACTVR